MTLSTNHTTDRPNLHQSAVVEANGDENDLPELVKLVVVLVRVRKLGWRLVNTNFA